MLPAAAAVFTVEVQEKKEEKKDNNDKMFDVISNKITVHDGVKGNVRNAFVWSYETLLFINFMKLSENF